MQREEVKNNVTYLVVKHHSICEESKEPRENWEAVEVRNPKTGETQIKYIDRYGGLTGFITGLELYDTEQKYDTRFQGLKIKIDDEGVLDLPQKTPAYDAFCKAGENIDFTQKVTLSAYHNRSKDRTGFSIKQNGENVDWKYTLENMGDCPQWEKDDDGEWNSSKQRVYFKKRIQEVIIPAVEAAQAERSGQEPAPDSVENVEEFSGPPVEATAEAAVEATAPEPVAKAASASGGKGKGKQPVKVSDDEIPF